MIKYIYVLKIYSDESGKEQYCKIKNYNYTLAAEFGFENSINNHDKMELDGPQTVTCNKRDFDPFAPITISTEVSIIIWKIYSLNQLVSFIAYSLM